VPDILAELRQFGVETYVHDPRADAAEAHEEYGVRLRPLDEFRELDAVVLAVAHREFVEAGATAIARLLKTSGVVVDVKSVLDAGALPPGMTYWCL
jgi:UDP-N-acetyl-D-galactosamine dehydrogenase